MQPETPATDRPTLDLDAIRARWNSHRNVHAASFPEAWRCCSGCRIAYDETPRLLAEVTALRAELDLARAERTEPATATGCGRRSVTGDCPDHPLPEPATGEDVEVVAGKVGAYRDSLLDDVEVAREILAALDLPGRERALREAEAQRDKWMESHHQLGKRLVASEEAHNVTIDERNDARDLVKARDAALADVSDLLDEARERLVEIKGLHHGVLGSQCAECRRPWPCQTYQLTLPDARQHATTEATPAADGGA